MSTATAPVDDRPTVYQALAAVMSEVRALEKRDRNTHFNFNFRGIDATLNALGPAFRSHGIIPIPRLLEINYRDVSTSKGKPAREVTLQVEYTFVGPRGDQSIPVVVPGESMDEADKGTAKAMSVAMRIALLQTFALPTDEPDPDASDVSRGTEYQPDIDGIRDAILDDKTSLDQLRGMRALLVPSRLAAAKVMGADDATETTLLRLVTTRGKELADQAKGTAQLAKEDKPTIPVSAAS